jgi:hypothetical protein
LKNDSEQDLTYHIEIHDLFDNKIIDQDVKGTQFTIDLSQDKFKKIPGFTYTITTLENTKIKSGEHALHKLKTAQRSEIETELTDLNAADDTALGNLILARFYEEKELLAHAIYAYEKALTVSDLEQYRNLYKAFLDRNYLSKESRETLADE